MMYTTDSTSQLHYNLLHLFSFRYCLIKCFAYAKHTIRQNLRVQFRWPTYCIAVIVQILVGTFLVCSDTNVLLL